MLAQRVLQAMQLTYEFYHLIEEDNLRLNMEGVPSNTIGEQAYCIIGARESYLCALQEGKWSGFRCSLPDCFNKILVNGKMQETQENIKSFLKLLPDKEVDASLLFDLLEHEVQHHGQLIRLAYANKLKFPISWNTRYTV